MASFICSTATTGCSRATQTPQRVMTTNSRRRITELRSRCSRLNAIRCAARCPCPFNAWLLGHQGSRCGRVITRVAFNFAERSLLHFALHAFWLGDPNSIAIVMARWLFDCQKNLTTACEFGRCPMHLSGAMFGSSPWPLRAATYRRPFARTDSLRRRPRPCIAGLRFL